MRLLLAATALIWALVLFMLWIIFADPAWADDRVIGDSNSMPRIDGSDWPALALPGAINNARGGASAQSYLDSCTEAGCWWGADAGPGQTWWVMLGTIDTATLSAVDSAQNVADVIDLLLETGVTDVRVLQPPSLIEHPWIDPERVLRIEELGDWLAMVCTTWENVNCVSDLRGLDESLYEWDGVHLNEEGRLIAAPEPSRDELLLFGVLAMLLGFIASALRSET